MGIAVWGIAMSYVFVLAAGFVGATLVLVWLFGEAPGEESTRTEKETAEGFRSNGRLRAGSTPSGSVRTGRSEDAAA